LSNPRQPRSIIPSTRSIPNLAIETPRFSTIVPIQNAAAASAIAGRLIHKARLIRIVGPTHRIPEPSTLTED
jgi:hypothetical protein